MTRRRNSINIYDYPEHLNPFREDVDDDCDRFNTTGRRRSSFRANAWAMFSGSKGKSKTSEDINPHSQSAASRFMTWTPKLLRRSFRRSSPSRTVSPSERSTPISSQIPFRSPNSRTSLPPSGSSHSSLHSSRSRSMLPPSSAPQHSPPPRPNSPPERPAPPDFRPQLSPSTQNADTTLVPTNRRALYTASPSGKSAGERPTEDEVKYLQQGAKPKKKRRAPLPPGPPPSKSPGDTRQVNSNESETSLTSSVTSSTTEEPTPHEQSVSASPDLKVIVQEPETQPEDEKSEPEQPENDEKESLENAELNSTKDSPPEQQNRILTEMSEIENNISDSQEFKSKDETDAQEKPENPTDKDIAEIQSEEKKMEGKPVNGLGYDKGSLENLKVDFDVVLHISEEDLREKTPPIQNGSHSESDVNHNVKQTLENNITKTDDSVKSNSPVDAKENELKLHNGENSLDENDLRGSETKLNAVNRKRSPSKTPEPKPRTILPTK